MPIAHTCRFAFALIPLLLHWQAPEAKAQQNLAFQTVMHLPLTGSTGAAVAANVTRARTAYGAGAICIRMNWSDFEPTSRGFFATDQLFQAIDNVLGQDMFLTLRFNFSVKPYWATNAPWAFPGPDNPFTDADFMALPSGRLFYSSYPTLDRLTYSVSSANVRSVLSTSFGDFVTQVVQRVNTHAATRRARFLDVTPTLMFTEETMYPRDENGSMRDYILDYSESAVVNFRAYLQTKYSNTISRLNAGWTVPGMSGQTSAFGSFAEIHPRNFNWHLWPADGIIHSYTLKDYQMYRGRKDWMEFRQTELKRFIDLLASTAHARTIDGQRVRFGLQVPHPSYSEWWNRANGNTIPYVEPVLEMMGWYDLTPLVENVDWVHQATNVEHQGLFEIDADYLRSICRYWSALRPAGQIVRFSTESNWPPQNALNNSAHNTGWINQLNIFRDRGASAHFVFGWDQILTSNPAPPAAFNGFITRLGQLRGTSIQTPSRSQAVHVSMAGLAATAGRFFPESQWAWNTSNGALTLYPMSDRRRRSILPGTASIPSSQFSFQVYDPATCDFFTDYMLNNNAIVNGGTRRYLNQNYSLLYLPMGSLNMDSTALENLLNRDLYARLVNGTQYMPGTPDGQPRYESVPGLNRIQNIPAPEVLRAIWKMNPDWQLLWPTANKIDKARRNSLGLPGDWNYDFPEFVVSNDRTLDSWRNRDINYRDWNLDGRAIAEQFADVGNNFPDGYHLTGSGENLEGRTMLDWILQVGVDLSTTRGRLGRYRYWPHSGTLAAYPLTWDMAPGANLTAEGALDWVHFGLTTATSLNFRSGTPQFTGMVKVGSGAQTRTTISPLQVSWSGGTPTASATNSTAGIAIAGTGSGYQFSVAAPSTPRVLLIYAGVNKGRGRLEVSLSDDSGTPPVVINTLSNPGGFSRAVYRVNFHSRSSTTRTLNVKWTLSEDNGGGSVQLQAAALRNY